MLPFHFGTPLLFFVAFLLLLLVSLSVPIIKSIYLLQLGATVSVGSGIFSASAQAAVNFGVFGWCSTAVNVAVATFHESEPAECSPKHLGYSVSPQIEQILSSIDANDLSDVITRSLTFVLVLHPVACALAFLGFLLTIISAVRPHRIASALATAIGLLASVITTLVFIIDIVLTGVAKSRIHSKTSGKGYAKFGDAQWLVLVSAILLWIACFAACLGIIRGRNPRRTNAERY